MKNICIIDDLDPKFTITSIRNLITSLNNYYATKFECDFYIIVPTKTELKEEADKRCGTLVNSLKKDSITLHFEVVCINNNPYDAIQKNAELIIDKSKPINGKYLIDLALVQGDIDRIKNNNIIMSVQLCEALYDNSFIYTHFPLLECSAPWNSLLKSKGLADKRIYFKSEINGELEFDVELAMALVSEVKYE